MTRHLCPLSTTCACEQRRGLHEARRYKAAERFRYGEQHGLRIGAPSTSIEIDYFEFVGTVEDEGGIAAAGKRHRAAGNQFQGSGQRRKTDRMGVLTQSPEPERQASLLQRCARRALSQNGVIVAIIG
jgi:hypothetical protein